jgi:mono/diheme cytochrome c family protein
MGKSGKIFRITVALMGAAISLAGCLNQTPTSFSEVTTLSSLGEIIPTDLGPSALQVLTKDCVSCHGGSASQGGLSNITNLQSLISSGMVQPGMPLNSPIYQYMSSGAMPPGGATQADIETVGNWIASGAPPLTSDTTATAPTGATSD